MYWSGLECGLAIIAACLPKLSYLFNRFSIQSAVNSVRSVFSLQSMRSGNLKSENNPAASANPYVDIESGSKTSSQAQIFGKGEPMMSIDQYPMEMFPKVTATQGGTPTYRDGLETKARSQILSVTLEIQWFIGRCECGGCARVLKETVEYKFLRSWNEFQRKRVRSLDRACNQTSYSEVQHKSVKITCCTGRRRSRYQDYSTLPPVERLVANFWLVLIALEIPRHRFTPICMRL